MSYYKLSWDDNDGFKHNSHCDELHDALMFLLEWSSPERRVSVTYVGEEYDEE